MKFTSLQISGDMSGVQKLFVVDRSNSFVINIKSKIIENKILPCHVLLIII